MIIQYKSALLFSFIFLNTLSQDKDCEVKTLDNGNIVVQYCISKLYDELGNRYVQIEDSTTTVAHIDFKKCISLMKDVQKHKLFTGDAKSKIVRNISPNEWIIYYYTDNSWPINNSDCVSRMTFTENVEEKTATFTLVASPSEYEKENVNRMTLFNIVYTFKDLENGKVRISMKGKSSPPVKVPMWLIKIAFPSAPANSIRKLVELIKK